MQLFNKTRGLANLIRQKLEIPSFEALIQSCESHITTRMRFLPHTLALWIVRILAAAIMAFVFSLPIYVLCAFEYLFYMDTPLWLGSLLGLISVYVYLKVPKSRRFGFGFFVGVFWFYWVGFAFRFLELTFLVPIIAIAVALIYGVIFWILLFCECLPVRLLGLLLLSLITPFSFDWLVPEALLAYSYFGVDLVSFCFLILGVYACIIFFRAWDKKFLLLSLFCMLVSIDYKSLYKSYDLKFMQEIALSQTQTPQNIKWDAQLARDIIAYNLALIENAIAEKKSVIILPETAFPLSLERDYTNFASVYEILLEYSKDITIIVGALSRRGEEAYNSTFIFDNATQSRIDKVILAPFGEYIPLPRFIKQHISVVADMEFSAGEAFGDIEILGKSFRNAICYEATTKALYNDYPEFVIAISNNAWFYPSIEPTLQKMLLKYYAKKYQSIIIHSANMSKSAIITP